MQHYNAQDKFELTIGGLNVEFDDEWKFDNDGELYIEVSFEYGGYFAKVMHNDRYNTVEFKGDIGDSIYDGMAPECLIFEFDDEDGNQYRIESTDLMSYNVEISIPEAPYGILTEIETCEYSFKPGIITSKDGAFIYKVLNGEHIFEYPHLGASFNATTLLFTARGETLQLGIKEYTITRA